MYLNEGRILGNRTRTPELKYINGTDMVNLSIAVNKNWTDKNTGQKMEKTEFISCVVFGKQAINCSQYLVKGQQVFVLGEINNRVIEKEDGSKDYKTGINAHTVLFGNKPRGSAESEAERAYSAPQQATEPVKSRVEGIEYPQDDINVGDIPF